MRTSRLFILHPSLGWKEVDLFDNVSVPMNYSVSDIQDISKRRTSYSLDIELPNTSSNCEIFEHLYRIESTGASIEMLRKYEAYLQVDGTNVFEGYFQLKEIYKDDLKRVTYKAIIYNAVKDFVEELGNQTLRGNTDSSDDLDFSSYAETASSMTLERFKDKLVTFPTNGGYGLTLIDKTNKGAENFSGNCQNWYADEISPYLTVKEIWDKIFAGEGYSYQSDFLNSDSFKKLIYPYANNNKKLGDTDNWQKIVAGNPFYWLDAYFNMDVPYDTLFGNSGEYVNFPSGYTLTDHNMGGTVSHWQFVAPTSSTYHIKINFPISLKVELHSYNWDGGTWNPRYEGEVTVGDTTKEYWLRTALYKNTTSNHIAVWGDFKNYESSYTTDASGRITIDGYTVKYEGDIRLQAGEKLFLNSGIQMDCAYYDSTWDRWFSYFLYRGTGGWVSVFPYPASIEIGQTAGVEIFSAQQNEYWGENMAFDPTYILNPKTKKWDFINSIVKMFNLYIEDIGDKRFRIEPRDMYYATDVKRDFTDKVDTSRMSFARVDTYIYNDVNFKFKQDKDVETEAYNNTYLTPYSEYMLAGALSSGGDAIDVQSIFGSTLCGVVNTQTDVLQCPKLYTFKSNSDVVNTDKEYSDRIFFVWQNNMGSHASTNNTIRIKSRYNSSTQTQRIYWCADILNAGYGADTQVLSWGDNELYYENTGDGTVTPNNLYDMYYSKMLTEMNDPEARILKCKMYLTADDIHSLRLSDTITVDNVDYRINLISQWVSAKEPTEVELIKIVAPSTSVKDRWQYFNSEMLVTNEQLNTMKGATADDDGASGWVPTPEAGDEEKFLRGDGTWQTVETGNTYTGVAPIDITNTEISLNVGGGLQVGDHDELTVKLDSTTMTLNTNGEITAYIPDIRVKHINYIDEVFDSKDFNWLDIVGTRDMTIVVNDYNTDDNLNTYRYFRLDTSNPEEENLYIFESDSEYLTYRNNNTWSISNKPATVDSIVIGATPVNPTDSGVITLVAGNNITLTPSGSQITIDSTGGVSSDAYIDYTLVAGTAPLSGDWITNHTYASKNTYNQTTGVGRFYLKPNTWIGGANTQYYTPFGSLTTLLTLDFRYSGLTEIGRMAVCQCTALTEVKIGNQIIEIGHQAFYGCTALTTLSDYNGLQTIGADAFRNCSSLTSITLSNCNVIGTRAFLACTSLTSVTLSLNNMFLGANAFANCTGITSLTLAGVPSLPPSIFDGCTGLTSVTIPNGVTHIGKRAFYGCSNLATLILPDTLVDVGLEAFRGTNSSIVVTCNAQIPPYCSNFAFGVNASGMTKPTSGSRVLKVPTNSLPYYKALNSTYGVVSGWALQFKDSNIQASDIEAVIRYNASSAVSGTWITNNTDTSRNSYDSTTGNGVLYLNSGVTTIGGSSSTDSSPFYNKTDLIFVDLTDSGLTTIGSYAFRYSTLVSIVIPSSVTTIGLSVFRQCPFLETVTGLENTTITAIEEGLFKDSPMLSSVKLPNTLTTIGYAAFQNCSALTSIVLPSSLTSIGGFAFNATNQNLTDVTCYATTPPTLGTSNFNASTDTLKVLPSCLIVYRNNSDWSGKFTNIRVIP